MPLGDGTWVDKLEPVGQKYPALQLPVGALRPDVWQYAPAVHGVEADRPVWLQYDPALHAVGAPMPLAGQ